MNNFQQVLRNMSMTTGDLADRLKVNQSTVSRWMTGSSKPTRSKMINAMAEIHDEHVEAANFVKDSLPGVLR